LRDAATEWFAGRTFHHSRFADAAALVELKRQQNVTVSVCIPTLNEESTIRDIVGTISAELVERVPLVDELVVMDSRSTDGTAEAAAEAGARVFQDHEVLPEVEPLTGKGEALWKSLFVLRGDVILWLDADIENFHPRFVLGPLGPLLTDPAIGYVKSFYERPVRESEAPVPVGGGRVTELVARPLLNMFWPQLAGLVQPLAGEYAGRRRILEQVPFFTGYGVEIGLIIDVAERFGLQAMAQVDLDERRHRNRNIGELSRMAFAVLQTALHRLSSTDRLELHTPRGLGLVQFEKDVEGYRMQPSLIEVRERPPAVTVASYGAVR
jgi:glycosyltransferase involved in cell wall biosynthesis